MNQIFLIFVYGAIAIYASIFHNDLWQNVDYDYFLQISIIAFYSLKIPEQELEEGFTKFAFIMRLHKFFIIQYMYFGTLVNDWNSLFQQALVVTVFQVIAFIIPKDTFKAIYTNSYLNPLINLFTNFCNTILYMIFFNFTMGKLGQSGQFTKYFSENAEHEFYWIIFIMSILGPFVILFDTGVRISVKKALSELYIPVVVAAQWMLGAYVLVYSFQNYELVENFVQKIGLGSVLTDQVQILGLVLDINWIFSTAFLALLTAPKSQKKSTVAGNNGKGGKKQNKDISGSQSLEQIIKNNQQKLKKQ